MPSLMLDYLAMQEEIGQWLESMSKGLEPGRFRFCKESSYVPVKGHYGMVSTVFAMKIAWQTGIWERWPDDTKRACIDFIRSFQERDGRFVDPWLSAEVKMGLKDYGRLILGKYDRRFLQERKERNILAETRQGAASLIMVGLKPDYPLPVYVRQTGEVARYFDSFDWSKPWNTASQISKQLMFLSVNKKYFADEPMCDLLIDEILKCLANIRDDATGTWFTGAPSSADKINGAMKIFTGLQWVDRPFPDCTRLLDFALRQPFGTDGCGFLNRLFVVYQCRKVTPKEFRQNEISLLATNALDRLQAFKKGDGGFSFYQDKAQSCFLGAPTSRGDAISDMHGTVMISWALAIIAELLGDSAPPGSQEWRVHKS
ncbi:MAG: hypothetical protein JW938_06065 [Candidatus Omnitrophica bacterium]|nr:hypothetical protein [Candidatus Omnitrophota bacterium]